VADALIVTVPEIVAPLIGEVIATAGGVVSSDVPVVNVSSGVVLVLPSAACDWHL
jgi:hypothetical protein